MKIRFFLTPFYIADNYSPEAIALAEGLQELGIAYSCNIDYWYQPTQGHFLFQAADSDYDIGIYDYKYLYINKRVTLNRVDPSKINILLDRNEWLNPRWKDGRLLKLFDLILIDNKLRGFKYPDKVHPWAIGLTRRIMEYVDRYDNTEKIAASNQVASNFRVGHNLRKKLKEQLDPVLSRRFEIVNKIIDRSSGTQIDDTPTDQSYWEQSFGRHNPSYYHFLNQCLLTYAFGGYYEYKPYFYQPYNTYQKIARKPYFYLAHLLQSIGRDPAPAHMVFQYDSFRFWECLYSNSCPIHLDFHDWGCELPVMPEEGKHYIGIKGFKATQRAMELQKIDNESIAAIGRQGKEWVRTHYSPAAVAQRLLKLTETIKR